jgi:serine/threonine protein kinase
VAHGDVVARRVTRGPPPQRLAFEHMKRGDRFGSWTVESHLGSGGNGDVWKVVDVAGGVSALKLLRARGSSRLARFRDEVEFLRLYSEPGVLPLVDSHLDGPGPPWYVMPLAIPIRDALGRDPAPATVVEAIASIAEVLARLAARGVGHRDIKPDNLFQLDGGWVVGDFGLVSYPEKEPVTVQGRRLGPLDYMAPEMRADADTASPGPADVWSLAKTVWVLLADADLPLPGSHDLLNPTMSLRERINWHRVDQVDLLLERCTRMEPSARLTMSEFARELRALVTEPQVDDPPDLDDISGRLRAFVEPRQRRLDMDGDRRRRCNENWRKLEELTRAQWHELARLSTFNGPHPNGGHYATALLGKPPAEPYASYEWGGLLAPPGDSPAVLVLIASACRVQDDNERADFAAILTVESVLPDRTRRTEKIWKQTYRDVLVGSAQQTNIFREIERLFIAARPDALGACLDLMTPAGDVDS